MKVRWKWPILCDVHGSNICIAGTYCAMQRQKTGKLNRQLLNGKCSSLFSILDILPSAKWASSGLKKKVESNISIIPSTCRKNHFLCAMWISQVWLVQSPSDNYQLVLHSCVGCDLRYLAQQKIQRGNCHRWRGQHFELTMDNWGAQSRLEGAKL